MRILHLSLTNFRNYTRLELDLPQGILLLKGNNAEGKTNLLEAIYYLSRTRSPRTKSDRELVNWLALEDELPFARLTARIQKATGIDQIELCLLESSSKGRNRDATALRKHIRVNGASKRALDAIGLLNAVLFFPADIEAVGGPPHLRRRYLDDTIGQIDPKYRRELQRYNRVLTQRNSLLKSLRSRHGDPAQLLFWDQRLVEHGAYVLIRRREVIEKLDRFAERIHSQLTGGRERLRIVYRASVRDESCSGVARQIVLPTEQDALPVVVTSSRLRDVATSFSHQLCEVRSKELERGVSTIGPHRDDFRFLVDGVDMNTYGSRGQQRTIALSLKLAEVELMTQERNDEPVLLLDDVASELDAARRSYLLDTIAGAQQVIMTTTDLAPYGRKFVAGATLWHVCAGRIRERAPDPEAAC